MIALYFFLIASLLYPLHTLGGTTTTGRGKKDSRIQKGIRNRIFSSFTITKGDTEAPLRRRLLQSHKLFSARNQSVIYPHSKTSPSLQSLSLFLLPTPFSGFHFPPKQVQSPLLPTPSELSFPYPSALPFLLSMYIGAA